MPANFVQASPRDQAANNLKEMVPAGMASLVIACLEELIKAADEPLKNCDEAPNLDFAANHLWRLCQTSRRIIQKC